MTKETTTHVCPVERAGALDMNLRRLVHHPQKIFGNYIQEGMTVLDFGCGPGFFTIDVAKMVGENGKVIAADLQQGMLDKVNLKMNKHKVGHRINLHQCGADTIGLKEQVDFAYAFFVVHEVPDQEKLFKDLSEVVKKGGKFYMAEPRGHVKKNDFEASVALAKKQGFYPFEHKKVAIGRVVVFEKG
ncbi:MAG: class I SAM-dependent methyltransferase [Bacteroidales bacterium]|nr:class I SAM-dependent methyltransferase [Bacteroidales bacterium]